MKAIKSWSRLPVNVRNNLGIYLKRRLDYYVKHRHVQHVSIKRFWFVSSMLYSCQDDFQEMEQTRVSGTLQMMMCSLFHA